MSITIKPQDLDLIVYDFDGVLTDNRVYLHEDGQEGVACNRADGLAIDLLRTAGVTQIIISTETNRVVETRAKKLKLEVIQACEDKAYTLEALCRARGYRLDRVLYIGNDVNDLEAMRLVGYPVSPMDAHPSVRDISRVITTASGGHGVVRELADILLDAREGALRSRRDNSPDMADRIRNELEDTVRLRQSVARDEALLERLGEIAETIATALHSGAKVIFAGNGGSFADAQHLAAEFVGRFMTERGPLSAVCLGTNPSTTTAVGNDYEFGEVFGRELRAIARKGDVFIPISTSGNSRNLVNAVCVARDAGLTVFALLGKGGGRLAALAPSIVVPSDHTARIQELHITLGHIVCGLVDSLLETPQDSTRRA
jgi:D-sedoheptulose 7-phosphate isomerase